WVRRENAHDDRVDAAVVHLVALDDECRMSVGGLRTAWIAEVDPPDLASPDHARRRRRIAAAVCLRKATAAGGAPGWSAAFKGRFPRRCGRRRRSVSGKVLPGRSRKDAASSESMPPCVALDGAKHVIGQRDSGLHVLGITGNTPRLQATCPWRSPPAA